MYRYRDRYAHGEPRNSHRTSRSDWEAKHAGIRHTCVADHVTAMCFLQVIAIVRDLQRQYFPTAIPSSARPTVLPFRPYYIDVSDGGSYNQSPPMASIIYIYFLYTLKSTQLSSLQINFLPREVVMLVITERAPLYLQWMEVCVPHTSSIAWMMVIS